MKPLASLFFAFFLVINSGQSQDYVRLMDDQNANFYDIQDAFNKHWQGKPYEKGKGWKQFKRWEYFMEPRVYPSGQLLNPSLAYEEYLQFKNKYDSKKTSANNKSANWTPLGPTSWNSISSNPGIGRINAITVDPNNSNIIYVGAPSGGCWKSVDGGSSWLPITDELSSIGVSGIAIDPNNSNTIYIATGDGDGSNTYSIGVMKSIDGGATWNAAGLDWQTNQSSVMRRIIIDPTNSNILFVATSQGLYKTSDAGVNWTQVLGGSIKDVEFKAYNSNIVLTCTSNTFYKSTDGGDTGTFTSITNGLPTTGVGRFSIAVTPADSNYVYVLASKWNGGFLGLYRSIDGGSTFSLQADSPNVLGYYSTGLDNGGQAWYDMALVVSPTNKNEVYTGGINIWKSTDGGVTLTAITQFVWPPVNYEYVHPDIHALDFYGSTLYCGSDGGIFKSTDNGNTFTDLSTGIQNTQFYRLGGSVSSSGTILAGSQDNGTMLLNGSWTHVTQGDGTECIVDYSDPNIMYTSWQNGNLYKSTDGGNTFYISSGNIPGSGAWVTPYTQDPFNPNTLYMGYADVWKSTNGGNSWYAISALGNLYYLISLVVAPSNNNVIYAATGSTINKTTNGGSTWSDITSGLPTAAMTYISVHNTNPNILWVSFSGSMDGEKVYKSVDGGLTWTNESGNLPNVPLNCILYEYGSNNGIYVGTDMGVYYKNDDLTLWQSYTTGMPNCIVSELEIHYGSGKLRAATFGRGLWETDLYTPTAPVGQFYASVMDICEGDCVQFYNTSSDLGPQWQWYFPGGTPSTSTDLNPTVCYSTNGSYDVSLMVSNVIGNDSIAQTNYITVQPLSGGIIPPLVEGFENSSSIPVDWKVRNDDQGITWTYDSSVGGFGLSSFSVSLDNYTTAFEGQKDQLVTPLLDFSSLNDWKMTFDVAYAQRSALNQDTLAIYYSVDCEETKTLLWEKAGSDLATGISSSLYFTPNPNEWRNDTVDLNVLSGLGSAVILFENKSDNGNVLYIDNVNVHELLPVGISENIPNHITAYPNPFEYSFIIESDRKPISSVEVYNSVGQLVFEQKSGSKSNSVLVELKHLSSGLYLVKIRLENSIITKRLVKGYY